MIDQKTLDEFSKIYDETYNDVLRYVVCKCSNISDVEDIIQNIYFYMNEFNAQTRSRRRWAWAGRR